MGEPPVIFFDGVCGLCNRWVDFVLRRRRGGEFRFSPLQSDHAARTLPPLGIDPSSLASIVLVEGGRAHQRSDAVLRIFRGLGWPWRAAVVVRAVPRPIRDRCYDFVAKHRYRVFGRREACRLPTERERSLFLTDA